MKHRSFICTHKNAPAFITTVTSDEAAGWEQWAKTTHRILIPGIWRQSRCWRARSGLQIFPSQLVTSWKVKDDPNVKKKWPSLVILIGSWRKNRNVALKLCPGQDQLRSLTEVSDKSRTTPAPFKDTVDGWQNCVRYVAMVILNIHTQARTRKRNSCICIKFWWKE